MGHVKDEVYIPSLPITIGGAELKELIALL
jgi:hypothetical protein